MGCVHRRTVFASYRLNSNGKLFKFLPILITAVYLKDRNWISKTVYCISCSVVCKIVFCSEFPNLLDNTGKVTRRRRIYLFYQYGGYRVAIGNGVTNRGMWFQTLWLFHPFLPDFCVSPVFKESIIFISFHNKLWSYDDVTTAL